MVGLQWKGIQVVRSYAGKTHNPRTLRQQMHRALFAEASHLCRQLYGAVSLGMNSYSIANQTTAMGAFVKLNMPHLSVDSTLQVAVDYKQLQLSCGDLSGVEFGTPNFGTPCAVNVAIERDGLHDRRSSWFDHVVLVAYCPGKKASTFKTSVSRSDTSATLLLPSDWRGERIMLYSFVVGGLSCNQHLVSPTIFVGEGTAA